MATPDPVEAGRKGGRSRSAKKIAAAKRNGFQPRCQRCNPLEVAAAAPQVEMATMFERPEYARGPRSAPVLIAPKDGGQ
jgi:hypothetical protein